MKNKEIIEFAVMFLLLAVLLYRRFGKKSGKNMRDNESATGKKHFTTHAGDDDYEPYLNR